MKVSKKSSAEVEKEFKKNPPHKQGQWTIIMEQVKKTGVAVEVTDLSKGQIAGAARKAKDLGLRIRCVYKDGRVLILPAEPKTK